MSDNTLYLSASGDEKLAACEMRYVLTKQRGDSETSVALQLGTLWHRLTAAKRAGHRWDFELVRAIEEAGFTEDAHPEFFDRADWLMERHDKVYGTGFPFRMVAHELPFDLPVPGFSDVRLRGFIDGIVDLGAVGRRLRGAPEPDGPERHAHELWVWEDKSMGRWDRATQVGTPPVSWADAVASEYPDPTPAPETSDEWAEVPYRPEVTPAWDPQLGRYLWAASQFFPVRGAIFDAASTYQYKGDAPAEKSFRRIAVPFDEALVARVVDDMQRTATRAKQIIRRPKLAVRNVGRECQWCPFKAECLRGTP